MVQLTDHTDAVPDELPAPDPVADEPWTEGVRVLRDPVQETPSQSLRAVAEQTVTLPVVLLEEWAEQLRDLAWELHRGHDHVHAPIGGCDLGSCSVLTTLAYAIEHADERILP